MTKTSSFSSQNLAVEVITTRDASIAIVTFEQDGMLFTKTGTAKRDPSDRPDPVVGERLATARALEAMASMLRRQGEGQMKCNEDNRAASIAAAVRPVPKQFRLTSRFRRGPRPAKAAQV